MRKVTYWQHKRQTHTDTFQTSNTLQTWSYNSAKVNTCWSI